MLFTEYKDAAERHLTTCHYLVEKLGELKDKKLKGGLNSSEIQIEADLLSNLYYLSGYMLECLYSYAMCKYENDRQISSGHPISSDVRTTLTSAASGIYKICYDSRERSAKGVSYSIVRPQHRMSLSELSFFDQEAVVVAENIPLLHGSRQLSNADSQNLFVNWSAFERYKINYNSVSNFPNLDYKKLVTYFWEIVEVCAKMSEHILREVTRFRKVIKKKPPHL